MILSRLRIFEVPSIPRPILVCQERQQQEPKPSQTKPKPNRTKSKEESRCGFRISQSAKAAFNQHLTTKNATERRRSNAWPAVATLRCLSHRFFRCGSAPLAQCSQGTFGLVENACFGQWNHIRWEFFHCSFWEQPRRKTKKLRTILKNA